jgi:hypothetical protein
MSQPYKLPFFFAVFLSRRQKGLRIILHMDFGWRYLLSISIISSYLVPLWVLFISYGPRKPDFGQEASLLAWTSAVLAWIESAYLLHFF